MVTPGWSSRGARPLRSTATRENSIVIVSRAPAVAPRREYLRQPTRSSLRRPRRGGGACLPPRLRSRRSPEPREARSSSRAPCVGPRLAELGLGVVTGTLAGQLWRLCASASVACFARDSLLVADFTDPQRLALALLELDLLLVHRRGGGGARATKTQCCFRALRLATRRCTFFFGITRLSRFGDCSAIGRAPLADRLGVAPESADAAEDDRARPNARSREARAQHVARFARDPPGPPRTRLGDAPGRRIGPYTGRTRADRVVSRGRSRYGDRTLRREGRHQAIGNVLSGGDGETEGCVHVRSPRASAAAAPRPAPAPFRERNGRTEAFARVVPAATRERTRGAAQRRCAPPRRGQPRGASSTRAQHPGGARGRPGPRPGQPGSSFSARWVGRQPTRLVHADTCVRGALFHLAGQPACSTCSTFLSAFFPTAFFLFFCGVARSKSGFVSPRLTSPLLTRVCLRSADASGGGYWTRAPAPPLFADVAKQGTASVASGVRSPGAAPSAAPDAGASVPAGGARATPSAPAAEALNSLEALSLGPATLERPRRRRPRSPDRRAVDRRNRRRERARVSVSGSPDAARTTRTGTPRGRRTTRARVSRSPRGCTRRWGRPACRGWRG